MVRIIRQIVKWAFTGKRPCLQCPEFPTTNHGLCEECFNDLMDRQHEEYLAHLREMCA